MNKREIDDMMADLPSQQREESLLERWIIGTMFTIVLVAASMVPGIIR